MPREKALHATDGGGLAQYDGPNNSYFFVEAPDPDLGLEVGDPVPEEWGVWSVDPDPRPW